MYTAIIMLFTRQYLPHPKVRLCMYLYSCNPIYLSNIYGYYVICTALSFVMHIMPFTYILRNIQCIMVYCTVFNCKSVNVQHCRQVNECSCTNIGQPLIAQSFLQQQVLKIQILLHFSFYNVDFILWQYPLSVKCLKLVEPSFFSNCFKERTIRIHGF